jgi:hypothetical protein
VSAEDAAIAAAEAAMRAYFDLQAEAAGNPDTFDTARLEAVSSTTNLQADLELIESLSAKGWHAQGRTELSSITVLAVLDLVADPPPDAPPVVELRVCYDVTGLRIIDSAGNDVTDATREPNGVWKVGIVNYDYPTGPWTVDYTQRLDEPC